MLRLLSASYLREELRSSGGAGEVGDVLHSNCEPLTSGILLRLSVFNIDNLTP